MPAGAWLLAVSFWASLLAHALAVRIETSDFEVNSEASAGSAPRAKWVAGQASFRGGPRSAACEVLSQAISESGQVCTVDEFGQKAWLAAMELDCVLNRAQHVLDLLTKRFELDAQAGAASWADYEEQLLWSSKPARRTFFSTPAANSVPLRQLQANCKKDQPKSLWMRSRTWEASSVLVPTVCDLKDCPGGDGLNSTGQMYLEVPGGRPMILLPQPESKGFAYGYEGSQVRYLHSPAELTVWDVHKINKGLWFATLLAMAENFTETQALYFHGMHHYLRYSGNDPAILMPLVSSSEGKYKTRTGGLGKDMCIGSPNNNLIDSGNRGEFFQGRTARPVRDASVIRPYWRMSKRDHFTAVASKVVRDSDGLAMGTISLDLNMSGIAQKFLDSLNLTASSYGVIVDEVGRIMAITTNGRRLLFNETADTLFSHPPRCRPDMTPEELGSCSWKSVQPVTLAAVADGTYHSGADMSEVLRRMFAASSNCSSEMQTIDVKFPKAMTTAFKGLPNFHGRGLHLITACAFSAVPGWGLLIGTEYPDITEAADIRVDHWRRRTSASTRDAKVGKGPHELTLSAKYEFSGEADMRQFPEQWTYFRVVNRGRVAIPLKITLIGTATTEFIRLAKTHEKPFLLAPGAKKAFKVIISIANLHDLGTYTGTIQVQADRESPRGVCFPDPLVIRIRVKAKESKSIKYLKKLALYGFIPLIIIITFKVIQQWMRKNSKYDAIQNKMIEEALGSVSNIQHPMVLMSASCFKRLGRLVSHEEAQESHEALWLYTAKEVEDFAGKNRVVFISHQWTAFDVPDPTNTQYRAMVMSMETLRNEKDWKEDEMYIWVDYTSIPQRHRGTQLLAINSLTVYASHVAAFVVVAPHVEHKDLHEVCDKETYQCRAWCRAEQLAHLLVCGTANMYLAEEDVLTPLTSIEGWLEQSAYVFQGDLTCCRRKHEGMTRCDKEFLVTPMLGLWAQLCMRVEDQGRAGEPGTEEAVAIHAAISDNLDDIFPRKFIFSGAHGLKEQPLFSDLTDRLAVALDEERCKNNPTTTLGARRQTAAPAKSPTAAAAKSPTAAAAKSPTAAPAKSSAAAPSTPPP